MHIFTVFTAYCVYGIIRYILAHKNPRSTHRRLSFRNVRTGDTGVISVIYDYDTSYLFDAL